MNTVSTQEKADAKLPRFTGYPSHDFYSRIKGHVVRYCTSDCEINERGDGGMIICLPDEAVEVVEYLEKKGFEIEAYLSDDAGCFVMERPYPTHVSNAEAEARLASLIKLAKLDLER